MPLFDDRQHGFFNAKPCTTNMVSFSDSVVLSIKNYKTFGIDVVYFDFSKTFDSVNHDLILLKLKYYFGIDGKLLKFIENYLYGWEQCVAIDNAKFSSKPIPSGSEFDLYIILLLYFVSCTNCEVFDIRLVD